MTWLSKMIRPSPPVDVAISPSPAPRQPLSQRPTPIYSPSAEPPPPPATLEEAIERVRTHLMEGRAMLHCLSEVLLYADDPDSVTHAEVAQTISRWINYSAEQLDLVKLRPLIEAIRRAQGRASGEIRGTIRRIRCGSRPSFTTLNR